MTTIYLDKQVISNMLNRRNETYNELKNIIEQHQSEFLYFYSDAHLLDMTKDTTDVKYKELSFIDSLLGTNHLTCCNNKVNLFFESAAESFQKIKSIDQFSIDILLNNISEESIQPINNITDIFTSSINGELGTDWIRTRIPMGNSTLNFEVEQIRKTITAIMGRILDKKSFKRDLQISYMDLGKIPQYIAPLYKNNKLTCEYIQEIKRIFFQLGIDKYSNSSFYIMSYLMLQLFGINKEPTKNIQYHNLLIDSIHSYFGIQCDYIVSDDKGLREKSQLLYDLLEIKTKICCTEEFLKKLKKQIEIIELPLQEHINIILSDYNNGEIIDVKNIESVTTFQINSNFKYFGYFNHLICYQDDDIITITLLKNLHKHSVLYTKEIEIISNRLSRILAENKYVKFDYDKEISEINNNSWKGRTWFFKNAIAKFNKTENYPLLYMQIDIYIKQSTDLIKRKITVN